MRGLAYQLPHQPSRHMFVLCTKSPAMDDPSKQSSLQEPDKGVNDDIKSYRVFTGEMMRGTIVKGRVDVRAYCQGILAKDEIKMNSGSTTTTCDSEKRNLGGQWIVMTAHCQFKLSKRHQRINISSANNYLALYQNQKLSKNARQVEILLLLH